MMERILSMILKFSYIVKKIGLIFLAGLSGKSVYLLRTEGYTDFLLPVFILFLVLLLWAAYDDLKIAMALIEEGKNLFNEE